MASGVRGDGFDEPFVHDVANMLKGAACHVRKRKGDISRGLLAYRKKQLALFRWRWLRERSKVPVIQKAPDRWRKRGRDIDHVYAPRSLSEADKALIASTSKALRGASVPLHDKRLEVEQRTVANSVRFSSEQLAHRACPRPQSKAAQSLGIVIRPTK